MSEANRTRRLFARLAGLIDVHDILGIAGAGLVTYGLWQLHPPSALITLGIICLLAGVAGAKNADRG